MFTYDEHHFVGFEIKEGEVVRDFTRKLYGGEKQKSTANLDVSCTTHYYPVGYMTCAGSSCHTTVIYYIAETSCSGGDLGTTKSYEYPTGESSSDGTTATDGTGGNCSDCEYDPPSLLVPSFKIKNSISPDDYPCLRSGVNEAINKNFSSEIQKLILDVFDESENFNIEIEAFDFQDNTLDGTCVPTYIQPDGSYAKFLISINTHLENTSQEYITATVFHEFTHAYLDYLDLPNYSPNDSISHEEMATKYLDRLASILTVQYGISRSHAEALSWGGLGGSNLYNNLSVDKKNYIGQINYAYKYGDLGTKCN